MKKRFIADVCPHCQQTKNYLLSLDRGTALIMVALGHAVRRLGRNRVHLQREMECARGQFPNVQKMVQNGYLDSVMVRNVPRARYHGLVAFADREGGTGEYLLTRKGSEFLQGAEVPRCAIIDKTTHHNAGYWDELGDRTTLLQLLRESQNWIVPSLEIPKGGLSQPAMF